jgi:hypothetical protein
MEWCVMRGSPELGSVTFDFGPGALGVCAWEMARWGTPHLSPTSAL